MLDKGNFRLDGHLSQPDLFFFLQSIFWIYSGTKKLKRKQLFMTMEVMRGTKRRALHLNGLWRVFIEFKTDIDPLSSDIAQANV